MCPICRGDIEKGKSNENARIIGNNLKRIRKEVFNVTQKEFAHFIGMGVQNLSQSERGVYKPGLDKIISIAEKLELTPNDLILEKGSIGIKMKSKRVEQKMTQAELADCLGVSKRTVINYETGKTMPTSETMLACSAIFYRRGKYVNFQKITPKDRKTKI